MANDQDPNQEAQQRNKQTNQLPLSVQGMAAKWPGHLEISDKQRNDHRDRKVTSPSKQKISLLGQLSLQSHHADPVRDSIQ
jgi:hypothetical protein